MWHLVFRLLNQVSVKFSRKISINKQPLGDKISNARLPPALSRCSDNSFQATGINQKTSRNNLVSEFVSGHLLTIVMSDLWTVGGKRWDSVLQWLHPSQIIILSDLKSDLAP